MNDRIAFAFGFSLLAAGTVYGQGVTLTAAPGRGAITYSGTVFRPAAIAGEPYSAEQHQERVQTLADGTHITQKMGVQKMWRDSQGRTRTERPIIMINGDSSDEPTIVEIQDPVEGYQYILDTFKKIAHRSALPPPRAVIPQVRSGVAVVRQAPRAQTTPEQPKVTFEDLGTREVNGVLAQGRRSTHTIPVGARGNDRPLVTTTETWFSPDLKLVVLSKSSDPRSGDNTMELTNVSLAEPDPSLFLPPPDYTIVDETGSFSISYGQPPPPPPPPPAR